MELESKMSEYKSYIQKVFGKNSGILVENPQDILLERFSTGSLKLDRDLKGGFVKGTMIEIFGQSGGGKTTLCIQAVAEHQKKYPNEPILWIDLEKVFDPTYFTNIGIDVSDENKFLLVRPTAGEEAWDLMIHFAKTFGTGIIIVDSASLLLPKKEDEGMTGDAQMGSAAKMNSQGLRKLFPYMALGKVTLLLINQVRSTIGGYGDNTTTTGGKAFEFYARTRIRCSVSKGEEEINNIHKYKQVKSNYGHKDRVTETIIDYGYGFNKVRELLDISVDCNIIDKSGSWYSYGDTKLGQGVDKTVATLLDNPDLVEKIEQELKDKKCLE